MKKITLTLLVSFIFLSNLLNAQSKQRPLSIGLSAGILEYKGEFANEFLEFNLNHGAAGLHINYYFNNTFDAGATFFTGIVEASSDSISLGDNNSPLLGHRSFVTSLTGIEALGRLKFYNGEILKEDAKIGPYLAAGVGALILGGEDVVEPFALNFPMGLGFKIQITESFALNLMSLFNYTSTDRIDDLSPSGEKTNNPDTYLYHSFGANYSIKGNADTDNDGIKDKQDRCPEIAGVDNLQGCPDSDNDGIADLDDECVFLAGPIELKGCPDSDADGIMDLDDECPYVAGIDLFNGCPDTDNDLVADKDDACPEIPGVDTLQGCPDMDKDGIADKDDDCPELFGTKAMNGCPDSDNDLVADNKDNCPEVAGSPLNNGCPVLTKEEEAKIADIAKNIYFETGSDRIKASSKTKLIELIVILNKNKDTQLKIEGHTDSQGNDVSNLTLSKKRATAVKNFLTSNGIAENRLSSEGFGETKPVANNNTASGRAENRRVELKTFYGN